MIFRVPAVVVGHGGDGMQEGFSDRTGCGGDRDLLGRLKAAQVTG